MICCECLTLVTSLVNFSERITRVQKLYCILQSASSKEVPLNVQELRSKFGLLEEAPGTLTEVHYVDEKPKVGVQVGLLPEEPEPAFEELENPLTPKRVEKQIVDQGEQEPTGSNAQDPDYEADEYGVLVKLCNAYDISEHSSSSGGVLTRSLSPKCKRKSINVRYILIPIKATSAPDACEHMLPLGLYTGTSTKITGRLNQLDLTCLPVQSAPRSFALTTRWSGTDNATCPGPCPSQSSMPATVATRNLPAVRPPRSMRNTCI